MNWVLKTKNTKTKMAVKSTFRSSNPSESFGSTTFQFCLEKVCLALQKFHKAQTTNTPPTHRRRISYVIKLNSGQRVGRQSIDCWPTCGPTRRWDRILNFYPSRIILILHLTYSFIFKTSYARFHKTAVQGQITLS